MFHLNLPNLFEIARLGLSDVIIMCFIHPRSAYILQEGTQQCVITKKPKYRQYVGEKKVVAQFQM